mmetsp:Transcript_22650/g.38326  ORF Transcript_22650/g.38326 Transcript_22650/m.38326 type:complete len:127 (+) Transcript_22650:169-549(+)
MSSWTSRARPPLVHTSCDPPVAVVLISHGLHEHALRYYAVAHYLTARGAAVYACDHYAHGKSSGTRGLVTDGQALAEDMCTGWRATRDCRSRSWRTPWGPSWPPWRSTRSWLPGCRWQACCSPVQR